MRIFVHKLVVVFLIFGLVGGSMAVASSLRVNTRTAQSSSMAVMAGVLVTPAGMTQSCESDRPMNNCNMTHPPVISTGMSCCGCFPSSDSNLCIAPLENKLNAFGKLDVKGNSRAPASLLKPPRA